jgi:hypothetical protein
MNAQGVSPNFKHKYIYASRGGLNQLPSGNGLEMEMSVQTHT